MIPADQTIPGMQAGLWAIEAIPDDAVEHGEVFTRRWVVEFILDLAGYTADRDLARRGAELIGSHGQSAP